MLHFFWGNYILAEKSYSTYEYSNSEIVKWAEYYFSQYTSFHQASWFVGKVTENPKDVLIGHPSWDGRSKDEQLKLGPMIHNWVRENALTADAIAHPNTYILMPWVPEFPQQWTTRMPFFHDQLRAASKIFGLCGEIWYRQTMESDANTIQTEVRDKLVHCNMGLAAQNFPIHKTRFNPVGERQILHMSNLAAYKGFGITCKSVEGLETLLHVATPSLKAEEGLVEFEIDGETFVFNYIGCVSNDDPTFNQWAVENCDFYIHTATMDAQATTVLENAARGLVPLVTPESGFSSPHAIYLTHNPEENRRIINWALQLPDEELIKRSELVRQQISSEHRWDYIFGKIWNEIQADIDQRSEQLANIC